MIHKQFSELQLEKATELALTYPDKANCSVKSEDNNQVFTQADIAIGA